jgi:hypothetical protein
MNITMPRVTNRLTTGHIKLTKLMYYHQDFLCASNQKIF